MFTDKIISGSQIDITRKQVEWLKKLLWKTGIQVDSYTRTSRWWFDVKGEEIEDQNFGVCVWPSGSGFITKHMTWDEEYTRWEADREVLRERIQDLENTDMKEMKIKYEGA